MTAGRVGGVNPGTGQSGSAGYLRGEQGGAARVGDDVYATRDGNIYKRNSGGGWDQHQRSGSWSGVQSGDSNLDAQLASAGALDRKHAGSQLRRCEKHGSRRSPAVVAERGLRGPPAHRYDVPRGHHDSERTVAFRCQTRYIVCHSPVGRRRSCLGPIYVRRFIPIPAQSIGFLDDGKNEVAMKERVYADSCG